MCGYTRVPMKIKTWPRSTWTGTFMRYALRRDQLQWKSSQEVVTSYVCCLLNAIAAMERDCDLSGLRDHTGPMSAKEFNDAMIFSWQRPTYSNYRLTHADIGDVSEFVLATTPGRRRTSSASSAVCYVFVMWCCFSV